MRLIAHENRDTKSLAKKIPVAFQVCEKLRPHLATLTGNAGFRVLLGRALALATQQASWLRAVQIKPDGSLTTLNELAAQADPQKTAEGDVALLAELLALLVTFIGAILTLRILREVWPELPLNDFDFNRG